MSSSNWAKLAGWGQLFITAVAAAIQAKGIPATGAQWGAILASAAVAVAVHHAASTDGTK
jgi:hypothetical protein